MTREDASPLWESFSFSLVNVPPTKSRVPCESLVTEKPVLEQNDELRATIIVLIIKQNRVISYILKLKTHFFETAQPENFVIGTEPIVFAVYLIFGVAYSYL